MHQLLFSQSCHWCLQRVSAGQLLCDECLHTLPQHPHACWRCALPLPENAHICGPCLQRPPPYDHTIAALSYQETTQQLIWQLKFQQRWDIAEFLAQQLLPRIKQAPLPDAILPVPLHRHRLAQRGYNQALEIAKPLAKQLHLPLLTNQVKRTRATEAQSHLNAKQRHHNLRHAFTLCKPIPYQHIAVVDDVMTTGATLHAISSLLKRDISDKQVTVWVAARRS